MYKRQHKFHGLKGSGLLYIKERRNIKNISLGGGQENNLKSGTVNLANAVSTAKALRIYSEKVSEMNKKHYEFKKYLLEEFNKLKHVKVNSPLKKDYVNSIINISIEKIKGEAIINSLNAENIMVSTKSACSSKKNNINEALLSRGISDDDIKGSIRISFSCFTRKEELEEFIKIFKEKYKQFEEVIESGI